MLKAKGAWSREKNPDSKKRERIPQRAKKIVEILMFEDNGGRQSKRYQSCSGASTCNSLTPQEDSIRVRQRSIFGSGSKSTA